MSKFKYIFSRYKFSIAFALLLLGVFVVSLHHHINIVFALVNIAFIFFMLALIAKVSNKILRNLSALFVSFILSAGISFSLLFSSPLGLGNIASILETNFSEAAALPIGAYFVFPICLLTTTILCFKAINELKRLIYKQNIGLVLFVLILFINVSAVLIPVYQNSSFVSTYQKDLREMPLQTIYAYSSMRSPLLYGDIFGLVVYFYEKLEFQRFKNIEKVMPEGLVFSDSIKSVPIIYLVVGESAYRKRMSLYGYQKRTTPFLDSITRVDSSSINFYDAISIANITRDAVRFSLSFASPFNRNAFWTEKNVVELANDAKYNTSWLSNQGQAGLYDNYPSYIAKSSHKVYFETKLRKDDLDLLSILDKYHEKGGKQFIALHLMGSHFPFSERYDEVDDSYFMRSDTVSDYDKSIHHTDRFLNELYDYAKNIDKSSIIVYFSDHGADPNRGIHGLQNANISEYEIPLVILKNNIEFDVDSIVARYTNGGLVNNVNLSYILAELMGYSVDDATIRNTEENGSSIMLVNGYTIPFEMLDIICP